MQIEDLVRILEDPVCKSPLRLEGDHLLEPVSGRRWPIIAGRPCFLDNPPAGPGDDMGLSHPLPPFLAERMEVTEGLVLNLSAGSTARRFDNVIEAEIIWGANTDVVTDAHILPFRDSVFDGLACLNAFEHYHSPPKVVQEIRRVCKPGAWIYVETAFNQPMHLAPHHFYNATRYGVMKWFEGFSIISCHIPENGSMLHALAWAAMTARWQLAPGSTPETIAAFDELTIGELARLWDTGTVHEHPLFPGIRDIHQSLQQVYAGVVALEARCRKPYP